MAGIELGQLVTIIRECAGDSDDYDLDGDIIDIPFDQLGYDSLALMEVMSRLKQDHGIVVSEEVVIEMKTPRGALDAINAAAGAKS
jgi:act minimal PKS acyl carrier protein